MKIISAKTAGFCFGVQRAVDLCEKAAREHGDCITLGPIIHNAHVTEHLEKMGVRAVSDISEIEEKSTVIIRSHGASEKEYEKLKSLDANIIDATCPDVRKIHDIVRHESAQGRLPIIVGDRSHPEVMAISGWCSQCEIFETVNEFSQWVKIDKNAEKAMSFVFQTTSDKNKYHTFVEKIKKECTNSQVFDTICNATTKRQLEAEELSKTVDVVIVIGDKNSANSLRLADICKENCHRVYFVSNPEELESLDIRVTDTVGITAGASTPAWIIKEVTQNMMIDDVKQDETALDTDQQDQSTVDENVESPQLQNTAEVSEGSSVSQEESETASMDDTVAEVQPETDSDDMGETEAEPPGAESEAIADAETVSDAESVNETEATAEAEVAREADDATEAEAVAEALAEAPAEVLTDAPGDTLASPISDSDSSPADDSLSVDSEPLAQETAAEVSTQEEQQDEQVHETAETSSEAVDEESEVAESNDYFSDDDESSSEESFEEMLEKSIKTLHSGQRVTGIVTSITATEVSVDLGTKQSGYIPISEFMDDQNSDIEDLVKVGDSIESFVMRVNDVEGMVMLSKKRLDAIRNWTEIEDARDNRTIIEGVVSEENKGGVVVNIKGVRIFIPASQTGLPKTTPMTQLVKQPVRLIVTEVNQSRRRVVGSIRAVQSEERREKATQLWSEIAEGKQYDGVVKSMTSYGVFVDIGGVDGMIHISELSWTRIKQPSEVMSIGDEVSVYVLSFDTENKKISLGYKKAEDNPWTKFTNQYSAGDIANVKIVKMMPFGAFAEIVPGVDGLIHISQITDHRIGLPSEILSDGQQVDVKITEIDYDRKKVSLSIRALIAPGMMPISEVEVAQASSQEDNSPVVVFDTDSPPDNYVDMDGDDYSDTIGEETEEISDFSDFSADSDAEEDDFAETDDGEATEDSDES